MKNKIDLLNKVRDGSTKDSEKGIIQLMWRLSKN